MDRKSQSSDSAIASALLEKLKNDLALNAEDRQNAEEEAAAAVPVGKRYTFRTMSKAEYLAKKNIADKIAAAADDADITDEELEALLRNYFAGKNAEETDAAEEAAPEAAASPAEPEKTDAEEQPAETVSAVIMDPAQPLTEAEELFVEELPVDVDSAEEPAEISEPAETTETTETTETSEQTEQTEQTEAAEPEAAAEEDAEAPAAAEEAVPETEAAETAEELLPWPESDDAADLFSAHTGRHAKDGNAQMSADEIPDTVIIPAEDGEDADLAALLAELSEDILDEQAPAETAAADTDSTGELRFDTLNADPAPLSQAEASADTGASDALEDILADTEALLNELDFSSGLFDTAVPAEEPVSTAETAPAAEDKNEAEASAPSIPFTTAEKSDVDLASLDEMLGDLLPEEGAADTEDSLADMLAVIAEETEPADKPASPVDSRSTDEPVKAAAAEDIPGETASEETVPAEAVPEKPEPEKKEQNDPASTPGKPADPDAPEFDQTDLDLMIAFGMDEQLEKAVGKEEAKKYKKAIGDRKDDHYKEMHHSDRPDTVQDRHAEYVSGAQNKEIFAEYKKQYGSLLFRFLGAILFLLLLFFFENNKLIGLKLPAIFDREQYPLVYTLFDLQLVLLSGAMIAKSIKTGIRGIFRARPIPESITGFLFLACIVYSVIIALLCPMHGLQLYNFPIALTVIFALCYEYMNLRREIMSFKIVSSKKLKYAVDAIAPKDGEAEKNMFAEYIADDPSMFRIKRTAFVENFFQRTETYPKTQRILRTMLPAVLILVLGFFAADFMLTGSVYGALTVAYITMLLALPSCAFIAFSYPMYRASSFAYEKDSAMIGEASLGEYADASVVSFDDKEVFPAQGVHVRSVKVYGSNRIDHVVYAAASVFHVVGGPLSDVFETATGELGYAENVKLVKIDRDGIEARVDGGAVLCGRASFVTRYGYSVSVSESEKAMEETGDASILYIAYENNLAAKLYIQYSVDPEFETVLKQLYRQGVCVGIKSSDPNIDDHLLSCKIKMSKYPVRIIKCAEPKETAIIVDRLSSGIVSKASAKSLLQTLAMCDRVLSASRTNNVISIVSILLAMAAMAFFVISGISLTVAPLWIALYQLFWIIPVIAVSRYHI